MMTENVEEKLNAVTETATLLCGPGTFLGSQLFSGVSSWGVEIKAVDFATIHAVLAMQKEQEQLQQQQQQQQQQQGTTIGVSTNDPSSPHNDKTTPATSVQPDNNNNNNDNNRSTNEKFVSSPSVVLCRIPAEVLLHHKGYTNANGATIQPFNTHILLHAIDLPR